MFPVHRAIQTVLLSLGVLSVLALGLAVGPVQASPRASDSTGSAPRIVGGERAPAGRYPWMVALVDKWVRGGREAVFCGGVLVGADWVVTAEHCTWGMNRKRIEAVPGAVDLRGDRGNGIGVSDIHRSKAPGLDIALLHLDSPSGKTPLGISGRLPDAGALATALGWGATRSGGRLVSRLRQVEVEVRSLGECRDSYFGAFIPSAMLCAGGSGRDTCQGDSGGPLVLEGELVGITSFGRGCGTWPGVYARVDTLSPWVKSVVTRDRLRHRKSKQRRRARAKKRQEARARSFGQLRSQR